MTIAALMGAGPTFVAACVATERYQELREQPPIKSHLPETAGEQLFGIGESVWLKTSIVDGLPQTVWIGTPHALVPLFKGEIGVIDEVRIVSVPAYVVAPAPLIKRAARKRVQHGPRKHGKWWA